MQKFEFIKNLSDRRILEFPHFDFYILQNLL